MIVESVKKTVGGTFSGILGLSMMSIGAYSVGLPPHDFGAEWELINYFQMVFGGAGIIVGLLLALFGAAILLEGVFGEKEEDDKK